MKKGVKIFVFVVVAASILGLSGCKTIAQKLGIPYGQVKKTEKILK